MKYVCELCGCIYDEEKGNPKRGIAPGTPFDKLPDTYECPGCSYQKEAYNPLNPHSGALRNRPDFAPPEWRKPD